MTVPGETRQPVGLPDVHMPVTDAHIGNDNLRTINYVCICKTLEFSHVFDTRPKIRLECGFVFPVRPEHVEKPACQREPAANVTLRPPPFHSVYLVTRHFLSPRHFYCLCRGLDHGIVHPPIPRRRSAASWQAPFAGKRYSGPLDNPRCHGRNHPGVCGPPARISRPQPGGSPVRSRELTARPAVAPGSLPCLRQPPDR